MEHFYSNGVTKNKAFTSLPIIGFVFTFSAASEKTRKEFSVLATFQNYYNPCSETAWLLGLLCGPVLWIASKSIWEKAAQRTEQNCYNTVSKKHSLCEEHSIGSKFKRVFHSLPVHEITSLLKIALFSPTVLKQMIERCRFTPATVIVCSSSDLHLKMEMPAMGTRQTINGPTSFSHLITFTEPDLLLLIWSVVFCLLGQPFSQRNNESSALTGKYWRGQSLSRWQKVMQRTHLEHSNRGKQTKWSLETHLVNSAKKKGNWDPSCSAFHMQTQVKNTEAETRSRVENRAIS